MDFFTFDYTTTDSGVAPPAIIEASGSNTFNNDVNISGGEFTIGSGTGSSGGYKFPSSIGPQGYVLASDVTANSLVWVSNASGGGGGDIINGGNSGPVSIGTLDGTNFNLVSGGEINIGQTGVPDQIKLNGSVGFQYDEINTALGTLNLNSDYFFVEITNSGTNTVLLPDASTAIGRQYIISKGFSGGTLLITTTVSDTIDGNNQLPLIGLNQRIKLISNGTNKWIIL